MYLFVATGHMRLFRSLFMTLSGKIILKKSGTFVSSFQRRLMLPVLNALKK